MSFTAILDFRILSSTVPSPPHDTEKCSSNQQYDRYKDVCRNMTCATGSIYMDGECKRQYTSEAFKSYDVYFRITPEHDFCVASLDLFGTELSMSVFSTLNGSSSLRNSICSFAPLFMPGNEDCDGKNLSSVTYALIHVGIYLSAVHSVDQVLTELSLLDNSLIVVGSHRFTITIDSRYYGEIAFDSLIDTRRYTDPDTKKILLRLHSNRIVSNIGQYPIRHLRVTELIYCRRVFLPSKEYSVTFNEGSICLEMISLFLTNGTYKQKQNGLEMCADLYFAHVQKLSRDSPKTEVCDSIHVSTWNALGLMSLIPATMSIISLILTILTYGLFESLRTTPGKNNMFLSINILVTQCLFQFGSGQRSLGVGCVVIGVLMHYFWLSAVVWTNICSFHMFRVFSSLKAKTMSSLRDEKKHMVTYIMYSVLTPLVVVAVNILVNLVTSDWSDIGYGGCVCYISSKHMIIYTFAIPLFVILLLNIIYFVIVVMAIRRSQHSKLSSNKDNVSIFVYVKLSCVTGASWIFGFLYIWKRYDVFCYLFVILTAGQGIFIFLSFICSKRVLKMYSKLMRCPSSNRNTSSSGTNKPVLSYLSSHSQNNVHQCTTRM
ncbi:adhesion G protein-coupled receptor L4-like [Pecten maximus]|uniref:adhesion G protein-coupled receptor L4-like n=1 Tax=Pecten maximus TaxID=6579 RepID=UPI001458509B|nr:adhesion G protein-coupled receptor L4-like [Pecten maximus]